MTDHDETEHSSDEDQDRTKKSPEKESIVERLKTLYAERPVFFAVLVMGIGGLLFLLGGLVSGDIDLGDLDLGVLSSMMQPGPRVTGLR